MKGQWCWRRLHGGVREINDIVIELNLSSHKERTGGLNNIANSQGCAERDRESS